MRKLFDATGMPLGGGMQEALKRSQTLLTYRFTAPLTAQEGECFQVNCHGHDQLPAFHFVIEVGSLAP